ncbi:MAG: 2,3-bisphosphoglycerate-independent phosphoglycerate mutase [Oscillospiraceae bacterium]|nr:2,3-bisphosphoglycerate-independent phosphoglycerate mutase [Oscillospiraceae bacterium]
MKTLALIILDGYGLGAPDGGNAVAAAKTPVLDGLLRDCEHTVLHASGEDVGLPRGQIGNSEVGHTNIGAGRVVYQELSRISREIDGGGFFENPALCEAADCAKNGGGSLHLFALVSPGGVHSHTKHLYALIDLAKRRGVPRVYVHAFTDGRDVPPGTAETYVRELDAYCKASGNAVIASVTGRYYAMDREERWDRLELAFDCIALGEAESCGSAVEAVQKSYGNGVTDEFIRPVIIDRDGTVRDGDAVIFANFRPDRARELTRAFTAPDTVGFSPKARYNNLRFVCMCRYDESLTNVSVAFGKSNITGTLGEAVSQAGLKQLRCAETTKYAHVTYFLNGGEEIVFPGEERILIPTRADVATFDEAPEMCAFEVAAAASERIRRGDISLAVVNFANCDMVGHTGVFGAAVKAVEAVDAALGILLDAVRSVGGAALVTADHGNAEEMLLPDGSPMTAHTTNLVPLILTGAEGGLRRGRLADIAPTALRLLGIPTPKEMTGDILVC